MTDEKVKLASAVERLRRVADDRTCTELEDIINTVLRALDERTAERDEARAATAAIGALAGCCEWCAKGGGGVVIKGGYMLNAKELGVYERMKLYGGSFVRALAEAWLRADFKNKAKLDEAFKEYFEAYAEETNGA